MKTNLELRELKDTKENRQILLEIYNDKDNKYFIHYNPKEKEMENLNIEDLDFYFAKNNLKLKFGIYLEDTLIGETCLLSNEKLYVKNIEGTTWLSISLRSKYHSKGYGRKAMELIHNKAKELGFKRIEIGVFETNIKAITLYESLGYKKIAKIPGFTYIPPKWVSDIRYEIDL